jgi:hypothetical protein
MNAIYQPSSTGHADISSHRPAASEVEALRSRILALEEQLLDAWLPLAGTDTSDAGDDPSNVRAQVEYDITGGSLTLDRSGALRFSDTTSTFFRTAPDLAPNPSPSLHPHPGHGVGVRPVRPVAQSYLPFPLEYFHHNLIVERAFIHLQWAEVIQEEPFRLGLQRSTRVRDNHFSPFLHLIVLAVGSRYLSAEEHSGMDSPTEHFDDRGDAYVAEARKMMLDECADPMLSTIRGLLAISAYEVGRGRE